MQFSAGILILATQALGVLAAGASTANPNNILGKRDCWHGANVGCTDGSCWKKCGTDESGTWCWTARNDGFGDWYTCSGDGDCNEDMPCSQAVEGCDECGCSCN
ncbi:hypothetical protein SLS62_008452 [Diatrype stigma]|uniref:Uncharacterized protein n=1 Tax=Diatrype stigma TaxID=117547 RepID=A0AAN9YNN9_9PEZI